MEQHTSSLKPPEAAASAIHGADMYALVNSNGLQFTRLPRITQQANQYVYTDGACAQQDSIRLHRAGIGVHFSSRPSADISAPLPTTSQTATGAEIYAILIADKFTPQGAHIHSDSQTALIKLSKLCRDTINQCTNGPTQISGSNSTV